MKIKHECGVFAVLQTNPAATKPCEAARLCAGGLASIQHRGQESTGIAVSNGSNCSVHKGMGLGATVFTEPSILQLKGHIALGHNRYSTRGKSSKENIQPFVDRIGIGWMAVAHNGQLVNAKSLRTELGEEADATRTSDSALIIQYIARASEKESFFTKNSDRIPEMKDWVRWLMCFMQRCTGAYAFVLMIKDCLFAVRDPHGLRPLALAELQPNLPTHASGFLVSSESCAFKHAKFIREIEPGEILCISAGGVELPELQSFQGRVPFPSRSFCIFEYVYFSQPDTVHDGQMVHSVRQRMGERLAFESPVPGAEVVGAVPDSANAIALGFSRQCGVPFNELLVRSRYLGRSFIEPTDERRQLIISKKFFPIKCNVESRSVVLVDDSIVRGNTMRAVVKLLRENGAREVHVRIASPPLTHPCFMGVDIPSEKDLIGARYNVEAINEFIGADTLRYLSWEGLLMAVTPLQQKTESSRGLYCGACFTGSYPIDIEDLGK